MASTRQRLAMEPLFVLISVMALSARIKEDPDRIYPTYPMSLQVRSVYWRPEGGRWQLGPHPAGGNLDSSRAVFVGRPVRHTPNAPQSLWYQREIINYYMGK